MFFRAPDRKRVPQQEAPLLPDLYRGLAAANRPDDVLVIPHAHEAGDWTRSDPDLERLVEIYSMHGSFEFFGNLYLKTRLARRVRRRLGRASSQARPHAAHPRARSVDADRRARRRDRAREVA